MKNVSDVLVVSSSDAMQALAKFALGRWWGVTIRNADSYEAAQQAMSIRAPQFAIVDMELPRADELGPELVRKTHVIAVNTTAPVKWATQCATAPFQPKKLHDAIDALPE